MSASEDHGFATPEDAARSGFPEPYCTVLGVHIEGEKAHVWLLTNDRPPFAGYEVFCVREGARWHEESGSGGFGAGTPWDILEKAFEIEGRFKD